jgi:hypothetical protein
VGFDLVMLVLYLFKSMGAGGVPNPLQFAVKVTQSHTTKRKGETERKKERERNIFKKRTRERKWRRDLMYF